MSVQSARGGDQDKAGGKGGEKAECTRVHEHFERLYSITKRNSLKVGWNEVR